MLSKLSKVAIRIPVFCLASLFNTTTHAFGSLNDSISGIHSSFLNKARFEFVSNTFLYQTSHLEYKISNNSTLVSVSLNIPKEKNEEEIRNHLKNIGFTGNELDEVTELYLKADKAVNRYLNTINNMDATDREKLRYANAADDIRLQQFAFEIEAAKEFGTPYGMKGDYYDGRLWHSLKKHIETVTN